MNAYICEPTEWRCVSMHDPEDRRGIWYKIVDGKLHVRGGKEGEDAYSIIDSRLLSVKEFNELVLALEYGACQQEDGTKVVLSHMERQSKRRLTPLEKQLLFGWQLGWINQPSSNQRWRHLHGLEVYMKSYDKTYDEIVYVEERKDPCWPSLMEKRCLARTPHQNSCFK